ncbi:hypothetical protein [Indioceanicola profundi]|uniref:hypothetical protein n=1 Tax=Indioceanicola profundi TaxID=2220096 RepID=UPI000E6A9C2F|nr:hypothetical protein [Indioceanicola profundi]
MAPHFDRVIGIDWTGANPAKGIAIADCSADGLVRPVFPSGRYWRREEAVEWLAGELAGGDRLLIGIDCAFSLPWVPGVGYLDGRVPDVEDIFALWELVEEASGGAPDQFAGPAVLDPRFHPSFWINGPMPDHWGDGDAKRRRTEVAAAATGAGTPVSVFKLAAASKQVGKASLAGMRSLRALRRRAGAGRLAVWPAEPTEGRSVVAEIYPTLFRKAALRSVVKITGREVLERAVRHFGARLDPAVPEGFDDHLGDALITAAGLRWLIQERPEVWHPPGLASDMARREGWILGVHG